MEDETTGEEVQSSESRPDLEGDEKRRLIEEFFPSEAVSEQSRRERYQRGKTPHTIFTWWARRPFAAASAVVATSLIEGRDFGAEIRERIDEYCRASEPGVLRMALEEQMDAGEQRILDLFGGGATIPLEAARAGARAYALDNNELAHFAQTALLQLSQQQEDLGRRVRRAGQALLEDFEAQTKSFFPARDAGDEGRTICYLWTREVRCEGCDGWLSLMRRPWVSKQSGRQWFVERRWEGDRGEFSVEIRREGEPGDGQSAWDGNEVECPRCQTRIERGEIDEVMGERARDRMVAVCTSEGRTKKTRTQFEVADKNRHVPKKTTLVAAIVDDLRVMDEQLPQAALPRWSGVTNPALYGMASHVELFNLRQRAVLIRMCRLLRDHHRMWVDDYGAESARALAALLSAFIDQLVDWNSRLSTWISQNEQVGRGLSGPGMAMVWDHVEIDPVEEAPANLWDKLERIVRGVRAIPRFRHLPQTVCADARQLPFDDDYFDVIATDPPYFDNIFYNVLADCIYVWKRLALREIFSDHFTPEMTDQSRELTMNRHVHRDADEATRYYTEGMQQVLSEGRRVLKDDGVLSLIFAHSTVEGWASIAAAIREAKMKMVAAWPMYVERRERPRGMSSRAVNTSFVLVARKRHTPIEPVGWPDFEDRLQSRLGRADDDYATDDKYGADTRGRTLFGLGISLYSDAGIVEYNGAPMGAGAVIDGIADIVEQLVGVEAWGVQRR